MTGSDRDHRPRPGEADSLPVGPVDAPVRVLALHYAGGSAVSMLPLVRRLPDRSAAVLLDLTGRGATAGEPPPASFDEAVEQLWPPFQRWVDRPTIVVGHSMGALLAHVLVSRLDSDQRRHIRDLVLSGSRSPVTSARLATHPPVPFVTRSRAQLTAELRRYGGCPPELFDDPELLGQALTLLGQDLHVVDTYREIGRLAGGSGTNFRVWFGCDDEELSLHEARLWGESVPDQPEVREFPGGHFFLLQEPQAIQSLHQLVRHRLTGLGEAADAR